MRGKILSLCVVSIICSCGTHRKLPKDKEATIETKTEVHLQSSEKATRDRKIEYVGNQWVKNISSPNTPSHGLQNRHISVWASHGRYYNNIKNRWEWQRPHLFCTTEDLYTQTIVVPYLIPMLENAGATVFSPRERDWQQNEFIIDNDDKHTSSYYTEVNMSGKWTKCEKNGFAATDDNIIYGNTNPFSLGTTRMAKTSRRPTCSIIYKPHFVAPGRYAVYVSYPITKNGITDAEYIVCHKGIKTVFNVNQQMGGGTWVYLGTFNFDKGCSIDNCVMLTNASKCNGYVTADAVRFGGGSGNINRGTSTSGLPRCLEGAKYYAQWAGTPDSVYNTKPDDDYKSDINARSHMTNWLAGGSCYVPTLKGNGVPIELSLAVHSDAGYAPDLTSLYGSLSICTTNFNNGIFNSGESRNASRQLAERLLDNLKTDLSSIYGKWVTREVYDRNYSETRCPEVPSAIIETLSHQSFPDMILGQDPNFRFSMARSIYKTILKFIAERHDCQYTVTPLAPDNPFIEFVDEGEIEIKWEASIDSNEPSARASSYIIYTSIGDKGFDNGEVVRTNKVRIHLLPNVIYRFKITATNNGGESFPTETLAAIYHPEADKTVLVVNGFHRVSAPAVRNTATEQGFDIDEDPGVPFFNTYGWNGRQTGFNKSNAGTLEQDGLGACSDELEGKLIAGNTFDYTVEHATAIMSANKYNVVSASSQAIENGLLDMCKYACVDYILGLERYNSYTPTYYKAFTQNTQKMLKQYSEHGGALLISGAYVSADMKTESERDFLRQVLHIDDNSPQTKSGTAVGMGTSLSIYDTLNPTHYAATKVDILSPISPAFCALTYGGGEPACVAYNSKSFRSIAMGFPFECIRTARKQALIMRGLLNFLLE